MKTLHVCSETTWGGGEKQAMQLVSGCRKHGLDIMVFSPTGSPVHKWCKKNKVNHQSASFSSGYSLIAIVSLIRLIKSFRPDLIHLHSSKSHTMAMIAGLFCQKIPYVLSRRVNIPIKKNLLSKWKYNHTRIKKIICVSQAVQDTMTEHISDPKKLTTIYGGIDIQTTQARAQPGFLFKYAKLHKDKTIGFIGSLSDIKNPLAFLKMAEKISANNASVRFAIIGDGPLTNEMKTYINDKNLSDRVVLTGFIEENIEALSSLDILVLTSESEGFPNVTLEAAALKVPVVSTDVGGVREFITHGQHGLLSAANSPDELAANCELILKDDKLATYLTDWAFERVQMFSHQNGTDQTIKLYLAILNQ